LSPPVPGRPLSRPAIPSVLYALCLSVAVAACAGHPEENSGPDAARDQATPIDVAEWLPDDLDARGDRTDWKMLVVEDLDMVRIRLVVAEPTTEVVLGLYDVYGKKLEETRKPAGAQLAARLEIHRRLNAGTFYLRVRAEKGPKTTYSLRTDIGAFGEEEYVGDDKALPE
jgi:hypothetical protein